MRTSDQRPPSNRAAMFMPSRAYLSVRCYWQLLSSSYNLCSYSDHDKAPYLQVVRDTEFKDVSIPQALALLKSSQ